jgi:hypothetical protein
MDHDHPVEALVAQRLKEVGKIAQLMGTQGSARLVQSLRECAAQADKRHVAAQADEGKLQRTILDAVGRHPRQKMCEAFVEGHPDIGIVIAGNEGDFVRRAKLRNPIAPARKLFPCRNVEQIAGESDVIGARCPYALERGKGNRSVVEMLAPAQPIGRAEKALQLEMMKGPRCRKRSEMDVRQMGEAEMQWQAFR